MLKVKMHLFPFLDVNDPANRTRRQFSAPRSGTPKCSCSGIKIFLLILLADDFVLIFRRVRILAINNFWFIFCLASVLPVKLDTIRRRQASKSVFNNTV
jgi:hypothetical protein